MRIRVRSKDTGETLRVEVPGDPSTIPRLQNLVDEVRKCLGERLDASSEIFLSLNKKDPLPGDSDATLTSLGLCNGDLVWLLSSTQPEIPSNYAQDCPTHILQRPTCSGSTSAASQPLMNNPESNQNAPAQENFPIREGNEEDLVEHGGSEVMEIDPGGVIGAEEHDDTTTTRESESESVVPVGLGIPSHLLRVLCANPELASSSHGVATLASHAAMLETGFQIARITEQQEGEVDQYKIPSTSAIGSTTHRILYTLRASSQVECMLTSSSMGQSTVVAASAPGDRTRSVHLASPVAVVDVSSTGIGTAGDEREAVPGAPHISFAADCQEVVLHNTLAVRPSTLRTLWNILKDGIALPMQAACCAAAGIPAPVGLTSLPIEIKMRILGALEPLDLASLACTCAELRHLAGGDELWRPLFQSQFPNPPYYVTELLQRRGFKWAFGHCWTDKRRREEEAARRRRRFAPAVPHFGYRPPFYPPGAPPRFPGTIVGGDQDRLPFLGGTGTHGAGFGTPFGLFRGSLNPRRQGGGGPSWF